MTSRSRVTVKVLRLANGKGLELPGYQSRDAAGLDLCAAIARGQKLTLKPGARTLVPTGFALALPHGFEAQVRPRSGLAAKFGVTVLNSPGTIDADYRGEISVILANLGTEPFVIRRGDRVAQMVIAPVTQARLTEAVRLAETTRGSGGFGSTGSTSQKAVHGKGERGNVIARIRTKSKTATTKRGRRSVP